MSLRLSGTVGGLLAVTIGLTCLADSPQVEGTLVAAVRNDGSMIPIAAFDGTEWWDRWPRQRPERDAVEVPPDLASIPTDWLPPGMTLPVTWRVFAEDGRVLPINVLRPIQASLLESLQVGLQTDYAGDPHPDRYHGAELAVAGPAIVGRFVEVGRDETADLFAQLAERLHVLEDAEIPRWIEETERPADTAERLRRVSPAPEEGPSAAYSFKRAELPFDGRTYYKLTGTKLYVYAEETCKMNMSFGGAVATETAGHVVFENLYASAWAEYCGDAAGWSETAATIQVGGQLLWAIIAIVEDGYSYVLLDPRTWIFQPRR